VLANDVGYPARIVEIRPAATGLPGDAESAAGAPPRSACGRTRCGRRGPHSLALAEPGPVRVTIYDAAGRFVRRLAACERPAGPQELIWDRCDGAGRALPAGLYLVELQAAGRAQTRKAVLPALGSTGGARLPRAATDGPY